MPERFVQTDPGSGGPVINIDLGGLADAIWSSLMSHLGQLGRAMWSDLSQWIYSLLRGLLLALWHATLLPIPHDVTDQFGPVLAMMPAPGAVAAAGMTLALTLMGLRTLLRAVPFDYQPAADFLLGRLIAWGGLLALLPWLIGTAIDVERQLAAAVATGAVGSLDELLPEVATPNPIALVLMLVLGLRLMVKLASNVVHVAIAIVWSPVAAFLGLIPETSHVGTLWLHEFFGRLAGAVLATVAVFVGLAIALVNGGDFAIFGAAGAFVAAYDLVDWLAKTPSSSPAGVVGGMARTAALASGALSGWSGWGASSLPSGQGSSASGPGGSALPPGRGLAPYYSFD